MNASRSKFEVFNPEIAEETEVCVVIMSATVRGLKM